MSLGEVYRYWGRVYKLRECMRAWSIGWGVSFGGVYRHWGRVYVLRECMRTWSIGWGCVFRRSLQALG